MDFHSDLEGPELDHLGSRNHFRGDLCGWNADQLCSPLSGSHHQGQHRWMGSLRACGDPETSGSPDPSILCFWMRRPSLLWTERGSSLSKYFLASLPKVWLWIGGGGTVSGSRTLSIPSSGKFYTQEWENFCPWLWKTPHPWIWKTFLL